MAKKKAPGSKAKRRAKHDIWRDHWRTAPVTLTITGTDINHSFPKLETAVAVAIMMVIAEQAQDFIKISYDKNSCIMIDVQSLEDGEGVAIGLSPNAFGDQADNIRAEVVELIEEALLLCLHFNDIDFAVLSIEEGESGDRWNDVQGYNSFEEAVCGLVDTVNRAPASWVMYLAGRFADRIIKVCTVPPPPNPARPGDRMFLWAAVARTVLGKRFEEAIASAYPAAGATTGAWQGRGISA